MHTNTHTHTHKMKADTVEDETNKTSSILMNNKREVKTEGLLINSASFSFSRSTFCMLGNDVGSAINSHFLTTNILTTIISISLQHLYDRLDPVDSALL